MQKSKRKEIPLKEDKENAIRTARDFIISSSINWLPVDPFQIYEKYEWYLFDWNEARFILKCADPLNLKKTKSEARTFIPRGSSDVLTVYDPSIKPFTRIRWTLCHEIGHIMLGHLHLYEETALSRGGLTPKKYKVLEDEADFFAAELLGPMAILKTIGAWHQDEIMDVCCISKKAAENREKDIQWWGHKRIAWEADTSLKNQFKDYLKFVPVCSSYPNFIIKSIKSVYGGVEKMSEKKSFIITNNNRFSECPRCGNTSFSDDANFCKMCGLYLYNGCGQVPVFTHDEERGQYINPGDARYCEYCGNETYLTRMGLLMSWEEVVSTYKDINKGVFLKKTQKELGKEVMLDDIFIESIDDEDQVPF